MNVKRYEWVACDEHACHCDVVESAEGDMVDYEDYAALVDRCAALAAENAGLKEWSPNPHSASMFEAIEKAEKLMDDGMPELAMVEAFEILKMKRTPATDAFLAEVRASAVDEACLKISNAIVNCYQDEQIGLDEAATICGDFASELRKGVQS
ncbi:hypothetical protein H9Q89_06470 [Enterobacter cloacae]|uniref:hypothetical protein n=1 Tax=Enterobacter cloacae TaxID=550 RepID=UPI00164F309E|nr:hypothetical protein [Enterobacter cloacae]MBC6337864.1 hypothetical protein [Enterobacter cloacae]